MCCWTLEPLISQSSHLSAPSGRAVIGCWWCERWHVECGLYEWTHQLAVKSSLHNPIISCKKDESPTTIMEWSPSSSSSGRVFDGVSSLTEGGTKETCSADHQWTNIFWPTSTEMSQSQSQRIKHAAWWFAAFKDLRTFVNVSSASWQLASPWLSCYFPRSFSMQTLSGCMRVFFMGIMCSDFR